MSNDFTLHLNHIRDLFVEPEFDPFSLQEADTSGIDYLKAQLRASGLRGRGSLHLVLSTTPDEPGLAVRTQTALARYCRFKMRQNHSEIIAERWKGLKALQNGVVFLALCLLLSALLKETDTMPEWLNAFLSEGLIIAGWVSMWYPLEVLLYEWWPGYRDHQIYAYISRMDVHIEAKDS